jgi:hypothetical protein
MLFAPTSIRLALGVAAESAPRPTGMNRRAADVETGETRSGQEASWRGSINSQAREQVRFTLSWTYLVSTPHHDRVHRGIHPQMDQLRRWHTGHHGAASEPVSRSMARGVRVLPVDAQESGTPRLLNCRREASVSARLDSPCDTGRPTKEAASRRTSQLRSRRYTTRSGILPC